MKVKALTKTWYAGKEYEEGEEYDHDDGADLRAAIAVGKVKPADEEYSESKPVAPMSTENTPELVPGKKEEP